MTGTDAQVVGAPEDEVEAAPELEGESHGLVTGKEVIKGEVIDDAGISKLLAAQEELNTTVKQGLRSCMLLVLALFAVAMLTFAFSRG
eukprot:CAMPEP_0115126944 /NCGR_PEP_ID=MMETSP0227-20121206/50072_1 /TAXON_ID=89957 /ORGANISM="Polarella glacialis, Strain CCMP 1383" /LENGTH=87 /DNA_ID=CAMNT_0002530869 /DNA_START=15 /DNA_END=274 /DNA_ORIENTATION=+